ncbi:synaptic plasticity regulator PANTS [Nomia melanderi]|uniref:synaptic plasticity regulator PANTS n=1 Tax=Nomia melanderi TaxID=2448451 RepID=UPI001304725D|nr:UPF0545 protein C22orf39 homolog [Nomia melanderi]XP_031843564.1 UPF0545 protein C22orf39 homolog [Nomia melanderi]
MSESKEATESVPVKEKEKSEELRKFEWMIRPCEVYKDEYVDCRSMKARFHQYFVLGKLIDCEHWISDHRDCYRWLKDDSDEALANILEHEKQRRIERLGGHYRNDVWKKRDKPPEQWNAPLPEWLQKKYQNSFLMIVSKENEESSTGRSCIIS